MDSILQSLSNILHNLANVIFIGFFFVMSTVILPILSKKETSGAQILSEISKRSRWWLYGSLLTLGLTGTYLTLVDPNYSGMGHFDSVWAWALLVKHVLILLMVFFGFWFNAIKKVGPKLLSTSNAAGGMINFKRYINWMSLLGASILVLTAVAQI